MKKLCLTILLFGVCCAIRVRADVLVYDSFFSLNPNPVNIATGEAVFWTDADGGGPYGIYGGSWNTVTDGYGILFTQAGSYTYFDDNGNYGTINVTVKIVTVNIPPSVTITSPANHAVFSAPATFDFAATASDPDADGLSDVEFYVGANLVDDIFSAPFTTLVANLPAGSYTLTAIAYDNAGASATNSISITVGAAATTNYILPVACASIYSSGNVVTGSLNTGGNIHGGLEFAAFNGTVYSSILLALNPYGLPMWSPTVSVYGFDGGNGVLAGSNYNSGTLLGTLTFPANVTYGQVETFDVTRFVQSVKGPYFGFVLQDVGGSGDVFSSLNQYVGTPPELIAVLSTLPPALVGKQAGNQMVIAWNTNNATGLFLQSTTNLLSNASWTAVTNTPALIGGQLVVTNSIVGPGQFFRLSNH
jgi:hypothetical protein